MDSDLHTGPVNLWPQPPWDEPRTTLPRIGSGASHITSMCTCPQTAPEAPLRIPMSCLFRTCPITCGNSETGAREVINALAFHDQPFDRRSS